MHAFDRPTDGQTDGRTDRILIVKPRLYSMQRGQSESGSITNWHDVIYNEKVGVYQSTY